MAIICKAQRHTKCALAAAVRTAKSKETAGPMQLQSFTHNSEYENPNADRMSHPRRLWRYEDTCVFTCARVKVELTL